MKKGHKITLLILLVVSLFMILMPNYALRALWYQMPGIDDYKIFSNRVVEAGTYQPWDIAENYNEAELSDEVTERMMSYDPVAFLVIQDKKIVYENYWDGYDDNSISNSFSAAKSIIGLLIGAAIDDGYISGVDQKVSDFIPSFKEGRKNNITIRHLLTMSSGLDWDEAYASLFSPTTESYYGSDLRGLANNRKSIKDPGEDYYYSGIDSELLAMIVQQATGMTVSEYASEKFWKHMGPRHNALWSLDQENGMEKAYCCFNSNARDFARWGQLILNYGQWEGRQLLSEDYLMDATTPSSHLIDEDGNQVDYYGYQWWIIDYKGYKIPYMRGILGQYIFAIKEKNAVVVRLGHKRSDELIGMNRKDIYVYLDAALEILN